MTQTKEQIHEDLQTRMQIFALQDAGKYAEADALRKSKIPLEPWAADVMKKFCGTDWLKNSGYDLSLVKAEYGQNWLDR
jgi:hypothetical protein